MGHIKPSSLKERKLSSRTPKAKSSGSVTTQSRQIVVRQQRIVSAKSELSTAPGVKLQPRLEQDLRSDLGFAG